MAHGVYRAIVTSLQLDVAEAEAYIINYIIAVSFGDTQLTPSQALTHA